MKNLSKEQMEQVKALYEIRNQAQRMRKQGDLDNADNLEIALLKLLCQVDVIVFKSLAEKCKVNQ